MNQISDLPPDYNFGLDFDYNVWTADTRITLTNVPWANDYKDVYRPESQSDLDSYIDNRVNTNVNITNSSYAAVDRPIRLNIPINRITDYNYVRVTNGPQPVPGGDYQRSYYYFILGAQFVAPNCTEITVELDIWQTFGYEFELGMCYIERSHLLIAAENGFAQNGSRFLTVPEGLDLGDEYYSWRMQNLGAPANANANVVITSSISLIQNPGIPGTSPRTPTAGGSHIQGVSMATETYVIDWPNFASYMSQLSNYGYISRGIVRAVMMPNLSNFKQSNDTNGLTLVPQSNFGGGTVGPTAWPPIQVLRRPLQSTQSLSSPARKITPWTDHREAFPLPERFKHLKKFKTSPYTFIELSDNMSPPVQLRPELWHTNEVHQQISMIPYAERVVTYLDGYGGNQINGQMNVGYQSALVTTNFPQLPVVNDGASIALNTGAYTRQAARQNLDASYQRQLAAAQMGYTNAGIGIELANEQGRVSRNSDIQQTALTNRTMQQQWAASAISGAAQSTAMGAIGGIGGAGIGLAGAAMSAGAGYASNAISMNANNESLAIRNSANVSLSGSSAAAANQIRGNNLAMAQMAAKGDYQASIAMMNAAVRETEMSPPQMSAMTGGEFLNAITNIPTFEIRIKSMPTGIREKIGNFWLRFGYATNLFQEPPVDFHVMSHFTYWKMSETYVKRGNMPQIFRNALRGIFEKGVTVWKNADDIGVIDMAVNEPLDGIIVEVQ